MTLHEHEIKATEDELIKRKCILCQKSFTTWSADRIVCHDCSSDYDLSPRGGGYD